MLFFLLKSIHPLVGKVNYASPWHAGQDLPAAGGGLRQPRRVAGATCHKTGSEGFAFRSIRERPEAACLLPCRTWRTFGAHQPAESSGPTLVLFVEVIFHQFLSKATPGSWRRHTMFDGSTPIVSYFFF
jgi:hypothetical protein